MDEDKDKLFEDIIEDDSGDKEATVEKDLFDDISDEGELFNDKGENNKSESYKTFKYSFLLFLHNFCLFLIPFFSIQGCC